MKLENKLPQYELTIPSTKQKIKVRPFVVGEEKLLHMAIEGNDERDIINTTKQIVSNCILDDGIKIDTLPFFDVDYLFIALRAKSIGEVIPVKFTCNNIVGDDVCGQVFPADVDVSNVVIEDPQIPKEIKISGTHMIKMKYPNYATMKMILDNDNVINKKINIIAGSIDLIQDKTKIYTLKDLSPKEIKDFLEGMTQEQFRKLEHFIENFPTFFIGVKAKCPKCGYDHELEYREFTSFFD